MGAMPKRIPYDILAEYNARKDRPDSEKASWELQLDAHTREFEAQSLWKRMPTLLRRLKGRTRRFWDLRWAWNRHVVYRTQRAIRGYSEWDLSEFDTYFTKAAIAACKWQIEEGHTYSTLYVDMTQYGYENGPDSGREYEGYVEDLNVIINGFEHYVAAAEDHERCDCCETLCYGADCPIVKEAWDMFTKLWSSLND